MRTNPALILGGLLSAAAALLHLAVILVGPDAYRFFGAGEEMARLAEAGHWYPVVVTIGIAIVLSIWAAYAFAGAGLIPRLPLMRTALVVVSTIYLLRGLVLVPAFVMNGGAFEPFVLWSSLIVLVYGIAYAVGTWIAWSRLSPPCPTRETA